jgi:hypothetical protein
MMAYERAAPAAPTPAARGGDTRGYPASEAPAVVRNSGLRAASSAKGP